MKKMKPGDNLGAGELLLKLECSGTAWPKKQHLIRDQNEAKPALFRASAKAQRRDSGPATTVGGATTLGEEPGRDFSRLRLLQTQSLEPVSLYRVLLPWE